MRRRTYNKTTSKGGSGQIQYAGNNANELYRSVNFGKSWELIKKFASGNGIIGVVASFDGNYILVSPHAGYVALSKDAGKTWVNTNIWMPIQTYNNLAMTPDGKYMAACGANSILNLSRNSGETFDGIQVDTNISDLNAVAMSSDVKHIAVARKGYKIIISSDNGNSFIDANVSNVNDVSIAMSANGQHQTRLYYGIFYVSNDYGKTWAQNNKWINASLNRGRVSMSADGKYQTIAVYGDYIYRSENFGATWEAIQSIGVYQFMSVDISSDGRYQTAVSANGANGDIFQSSDFGKSFTAVGINAAWNCVAINK